MNNYLEKPRTLHNYGLGVPPEYKTKCPVCRVNEAQVFFNPHHMIRTNQVFPCAECKQKTDSVTVEERSWYEKNAKGIFKDKETGEEVVLDQRGRRMDNPYKNREFDTHGWLQTNKKAYKKHLESEGKL